MNKKYCYNNRLEVLQQGNCTQKYMCDSLHEIFNALPRYTWESISDIPFNSGVYIVFEKGEKYEDVDRIVRVGTHIGDGRLKKRLNCHFVNEKKDRSIFRKNVGKAMLNKDGDAYLEAWSLNSAKKENAASIDRMKQAEIEKRVSEYMRSAFSFAVFSVADRDERLRLEEGIIATLNSCVKFGPGPEWNGLYSPEEKIRTSGMWLKQGLNGTPLSDKELLRIKELC